jgi:RNA-directed DNA polymerase
VRIAQATKEGNWSKVRALQRLLTHSYSGKVLAVRRVTENNGKKTPGVDKEIWNTPEKKTQAVHALKRRGYQPQPLRRVYIPKSDGKTMRPLGIPTMTDRAQQALHLLALDPVVETTADHNSYGFRQQRSCGDAIDQCFKALKNANTQWVLEGDIKSCFDRISHAWLLTHTPMDRVILKKWLTPGYMEKHVLHETTDGTPQGGIITPRTQKITSNLTARSSWSVGHGTANDTSSNLDICRIWLYLYVIRLAPVPLRGHNTSIAHAPCCSVAVHSPRQFSSWPKCAPFPLARPIAISGRPSA